MSDVVRLRSQAIAVEAHPAFGGRVTSLVDRRSGREALWGSPARPHRRLPPGAAFDDAFAGGWDELVPNDDPMTRDGRALPDHGELWTSELDVVARDRAHVTLAGALPISGLTIEKRLATVGDELVVGLRIDNATLQAVDVQLKLHPALRIATGARVLAPVGPAHVPDRALSRAAEDFEWPNATGHDGAPVRTDIVPPAGPAAEWVVMPEAGRRGDGRCGLVHYGEDWAVTLAVDPDVLPALWVFADYGGWQGLRFLLLEPASDASSGRSNDAGGDVPRLGAGQALETTIRCRVGRSDLAHAMTGAAG